MPDESGLDPQARNRLIAVVRGLGSAAYDDPAKLKQQLSTFGSYETEYDLLARAAASRIPHDLAGAPPGPVNRLVDFLTRRFSADARVPFSQAKWVVESWALALDKVIVPQDALGGSFTEAQITVPAPVLPPIETPVNPVPPADSPQQPYASQQAPYPPPPLAGTPPLAGPPPAPPSGVPPLMPPGWQSPAGQFPGQPPYAGQPNQPGVWPPPSYGQSYAFDENTSGTLGPIPPSAETQKWSWGAFGVGWIWLIAHNMLGWGLLYLFGGFVAALVTGFCCMGIPVLNIAAAIALGVMGNRLAWQNRRYDNVEHFKQVERVWGAWGIALTVLQACLFVAGIVILIIAVATGKMSTPKTM